MPYINVDVDIDEIIGGMTSIELQNLADELYSDGYIPKQMETKTLQSIGFSESLDVLQKNRHLLSLEEEEYIHKLAKRF